MEMVKQDNRRQLSAKVCEILYGYISPYIEEVIILLVFKSYLHKITTSDTRVCCLAAINTGIFTRNMVLS